MPFALPSAFLAALATDLPSDFLRTEAGELTEYGRDWTRVFAPAPSAIAFPRSTEEVSRLLSLCHAHGVAVVPSGGRTGLAGGAVAARGELVLSLERMRRIDPVDVLGGTVRVQAGAITEAVHHHCREHGFTWPVDFASKGSSTVGGNIATNAGGVKVIRYGLTRNWVLGIEAVLADGTVLDCDRALEKNNTGLDLRQLFIGSEGTLGVITGATLKLARIGARADAMLFSVSGLAGVLELFRETRSSAPFPINAYEFFTEACLSRVQRHRKLRAPFDAPASHYVLLELESGGAAPPAALEEWLASVLERGLAADVVLAQSAREAGELWTLREGISESLSATGLPHKNDIALPVARLEAFTRALEGLLASRYPGYEVCLFGHIGDGNLHVNVMKPEALSKDEFHLRAAELDEAMYGLVRSHQGSISAEHGVGLLKKKSLGYSRGPAELALMRAIKRTLDPRGLLNPGKILDEEPSQVD